MTISIEQLASLVVPLWLGVSAAGCATDDTTNDEQIAFTATPSRMAGINFPPTQGTTNGGAFQPAIRPLAATPLPSSAITNLGG